VPFTGVQWGGWAAFLLERRRAETWEQKVLCRDPLGHTGREYSPSWGTSGRGYIASPRKKYPPGTIEQLFISKVQKYAQRADNLFTAFHCALP